MFLFFLHLIFCFFLQPLDSQIARKYPRKQVGREKISKNSSFMYSKLPLLFMSIPMNNELSSRQPVWSLGSHFARSRVATWLRFRAWWLPGDLRVNLQGKYRKQKVSISPRSINTFSQLATKKKLKISRETWKSIFPKRKSLFKCTLVDDDDMCVGFFFCCLHVWKSFSFFPCDLRQSDLDLYLYFTAVKSSMKTLTPSLLVVT